MVKTKIQFSKKSGRSDTVSKVPPKDAVKIIHYIPVSPCDSAVTPAVVKSIHQLKVYVSMFPGMWHGFPQYIEGSGGFLGGFLVVVVVKWRVMVMNPYNVFTFFLGGEDTLPKA